MDAFIVPTPVAFSRASALHTGSAVATRKRSSASCSRAGSPRIEFTQGFLGQKSVRRFIQNTIPAALARRPAVAVCEQGAQGEESQKAEQHSVLRSVVEELSKLKPRNARRIFAAAALAGTIALNTASPVLAAGLASAVDPARASSESWIYSQFVEAVEKREVERVTFSSDMSRAVVVDVDGNRHKVVLPPFNPNLLSFLEENGADVAVTRTAANEEANPAFDILSSLLLPGLFILGLYFLGRRMGGGGGPGGMGGGNNPLSMGLGGLALAWRAALAS
eukprot:tig00000704_g3314.t1